MMGMFRPETPPPGHRSFSSFSNDKNAASSTTPLVVFVGKQEEEEDALAAPVTTFATTCLLLWGNTPPPPPPTEKTTVERSVLLLKKEGAFHKEEPYLYEFERALKLHIKQEHREALNRLLHDMDRTKVPSELRRTKSAIVNFLLDGFYARNRPQASTFMHRFLLDKRKRREQEESRSGGKKK